MRLVTFAVLSCAGAMAPEVILVDAETYHNMRVCTQATDAAQIVVDLAGFKVKKSARSHYDQIRAWQVAHVPAMSACDAQYCVVMNRLVMAIAKESTSWLNRLSATDRAADLLFRSGHTQVGVCRMTKQLLNEQDANEIAKTILDSMRKKTVKFFGGFP